ncbi:hypothetical protein Tco_0804695 [Tanacetum coccineum]|uniref:Reverse transcriptase domain-containing protein n=1 Tax=Tanacetum coccineum TaxID=301880 RepID=A0ABQ5A604_9ASTR
MPSRIVASEQPVNTPSVDEANIAAMEGEIATIMAKFKQDMANLGTDQKETNEEDEVPKPKINFRSVVNEEKVDNSDFVFPMEAIITAQNKFANSLVVKLKNHFDALRDQDDLMREVNVGEFSGINESKYTYEPDPDLNSHSEVEEMGLNRAPKQSEVRQVVNENQLSICAILESHVDIFALFKNVEVVELLVLSHSSQAMHAKLWLKSTNAIIFSSFIYAGNLPIVCRQLWAKLDHHKHVDRRMPWLPMGDFNVALNLEDSYSSASTLNSAMIEFKDCFQYRSAYAIFQPYQILDHSPAVLKFPSITIDEHKNVEGHNIFQVVSKLKSLKKLFCKLLHDHGNLHDCVLKLRHELDEVQKALDLDPSNLNLKDVPNVFVSHYELFLGTSVPCEELNVTSLFYRKVSDKSNADLSCPISDAEINKILTNRIIKVIIEVVSDNQSAFVPSRRILDNILITKELMHNCHSNRGPPRCAFKVDIQKAYDTIDWRKREMRQGDTLSPYLFTLVMELQLINVCFADDLFFTCGDVDSARIIMEFLEEFNNTSGLVPSIPKSKVFFCNVSDHVKNAILTLMPFAEGELPVKYLGVPHISSRLLNMDCKILVDQATNRIGDWKNKSLSFVGRLQLCKSVISSMQVYSASILVIPKGIIYDIQQLIRGFLWCNGQYNRGKAKVAWENICLPKSEGGLGIRSLEIFNMALMTTHIWNIVSNKESLWIRWIHTYKLKGRSFWDIPIKADII